MKKLSLGIVTIMLVLAIMLPVTVNAATLTTQTTQMNVGDVVEIEVTTNQAVESIQFDLKFDRSKYEYVVDSATTDGKLEATDSNYIANDIVRVSAFDFNGAKADTVKMKFKAIAGGESVPFNVVGLVEIGESGETFDKGEITVKQIIGGEEVANGGQYLDANGNAITRLPQTGSQDAIRIYGSLVAGKNVVAYALPDSQDVVTSNTVKQQFGNGVTVKDGVLGTGDTFTINNQTYYILIYGDINGDGKVTTLDALNTAKVDQGTKAVDDVKSEALDIVKDSNKDSDEKANALANQAFILKKQYNTQNNTIIDVYPTEAGSDVNGVDAAAATSQNAYRYEDTVIARVSAKSGQTITQEMLTYKVKFEGSEVGNDIAEVTYVPDGSNFELKLYGTRAGTYEIIPMVVGANVEGGVAEGQAITVTLVDSPVVTDIEITDKNGNVIPKSEAIKVKATSRETEYKINFLHSYYKDGSLVETAKINTKDASITRTGSVTVAKFDDDQKPTKMLLNGTPIGGTGTVKIEVDNSVYGEANQVRNINVNVVGASEAAGISFNGTKLSATKTVVDSNINLYKDTVENPAGNNETKLENGTLYTIVPIQLIDVDGDEFDVKKGDIVEGKTAGTDYTGKIVIYETADTEYLSAQDVSIVYYKKENGVYVEKTNKEDLIDAIGISVSTSLEDGWEDYIRDGLSIEYDTPSGRKTANMKLNGVYENGVNVLTQAKEAEEPQEEEEVTVEPEATQPVDVAPQEVKAPVVPVEKTEPEAEKPQQPTTSEKEEDKEDTTTSKEEDKVEEEEDTKQEVEIPQEPVETEQAEVKEEVE
jgi:hypothetical protein